MVTTISNNQITASIKHMGAELFSLVNSANKEYMWNGNPDFWPKHSPVLFPIVGSLQHESYTFNEQVYTLSRHGFARDLEFELTEKTESSALFSLSATKETLQKYPFNFKLQIRYVLEENSIKISYNVINEGAIDMPFSIGAHPAFSLPRSFTDYNLEFEKDEELQYFLLEEGLISEKETLLPLANRRLALNYQLFENDALVFKSIASRSLTILENTKPYIRINFSDFPHLGLWTKPGAPFLCIEPWQGYSDTVTNGGNLFQKEGILIAAEGQSYDFLYEIELL